MILGKKKINMKKKSRCFNCLSFSSSDSSRKWSKPTPQRSRLPSKPNVTDSGKPGEKLMCSYW